MQATAAEWASVLLAALRVRLAGLDPALSEGAGVVFFVHDEVVLHVPADRADAAVEAVAAAERETRELLFPSSLVRFPLVTTVSDERTHI